MKPRKIQMIAILLFFMLATVACGITIPGGISIDTVATSAAATLNAMSSTAESVLTEMPHNVEELPTLEPPEPAAPIRVSFTTPDGSLYLWSDGTSTPQMLVANDHVTSSKISPDGQQIAFSRTADYQFMTLEVINADGSDRRILLDQAGAAALPRPADALGTEPAQIAWIPGSHMLSMSVRHYFEGPGLFLSPSFYTIDTASGIISTLFDTGNSTWQFVWSPDGSRVAVSRPDGIGVYAANGSLVASTVLSYPFVNTASEYAWTAYPTWSVDGTSLIARVPPADPFFASGADAYSSMWRVAADGLSGEQVFSGLMAYEMHGRTGVSPDLNKMLYFVRTGSPDENLSNLILSNLDGSGSVVVASGQYQSEPVWSADSLHYFYSLGYLPDSHPYIGTIGADPSPVSDFLNPTDIKWVDANRYLVVTNDGGRQRLLLGSIGLPTGLIYDSLTPSQNSISFSVNR